MRARWRSTLVVLAVVAAACGNTTVNGGAAGERPKLPLGAGSGAAGSASAATVKNEAVADASGSVAASMAPIRPIEYRLADGVEAPATSAKAYQVRLVKTDVAERVAKALGVKAADVDAAEGYGDWWYGNDEATAPSAVVSSGAIDCPPDAKCDAPPTTEPPKLEGVPQPDEAKAKAKAIVDELGLQVDDAGLEVQGLDGSYQTVVATPSVGGVPVPMLATSITFGAHGQIQFANGFLFGVDEIGDYPLVPLTTAFQRYQDGFGSGGVETMEAVSGQGTAVAGWAAAPDAAPVTTVDATDDSPPMTAEPPQPSPPPAPMPLPPQPAPEPMPVPPQPVPVDPQIIEITGARLVLEPVATGCLDDPIYLVPAFELLVAGGPGPIATVNAVTDDALDTSDSAKRAAADDQACPEDEVQDSSTGSGKAEPVVVPPTPGTAVEPQPLPTPDAPPPGAGTAEPEPAPAPDAPNGGAPTTAP